MMRELGQTIGDTVFENLGRAAGRVQENKPLPADVLASDDAYLVAFDAPGATAADVQVRYVEDRVEVRVDRFREFYDDFEMVYPGRGLSLEGSATLPDDAAVDADGATATLGEDGTLEVRIPKVDDGASVALEDVEAGVDETVEETAEREDAGTPVTDEESEEDATGDSGVDESDSEDDGDEAGADDES